MDLQFLLNVKKIKMLNEKTFIKLSFFTKLSFVFFVYILLQFIFAPKAQAATYNVTPTSACSLLDAYASIATNAAVGSCAAPSVPNTINIGAGTYTLPADLPAITPDGDLSIIGAGPTLTIIDGGGHTGINIGPDVSTHNYLVSNLTLQHFTALAGVGNVIASFKGNLTADKLVVRSNTCVDSTLPVCAIFSSNGGDSTFNITNSAVYDNFAGVLFASGNIAGATGITTLNMYNNTISNNYGAILLFENHPDGIDAIANVTNNTFANNETPFTGVFAVNRQEPTPIEYLTATLNLRNNIFNGNFNMTDGVFSDANCPSGVFDVGENAHIASLGGNISSDATCNTFFNQTNDKNSTDSFLGLLTLSNGTYVNPLASNSPAIGNAVAAGAPSTDQRGVSRPQGTNYDSGAYELAVNSPNPNPSNGGSSSSGMLAKTGVNSGIVVVVAALLISTGIISSAYLVEKGYKKKHPKN